MTAQPLPARSPRLARHRYQADVARPNACGLHTVYAVGRFTDYGDAVEWADREHPDAAFVTITYYNRESGWQGHRWAVRKSGRWSMHQ